MILHIFDSTAFVNALLEYPRMIRFNNVHMQYQSGHLALKNISIHIEQGAMAFHCG